MARRYQTLSTFAKGIPGSVALSLGQSGGRHCDRGCRYHPRSTHRDPAPVCYAVRVENRPDRQQLSDKLARHESTASWILVGRALAELSADVCSGRRIPWLRISTAAGIPNPGAEGKRFTPIFRRLLEFARDNGIPVHLPVETSRKASYWRRRVGDLACVRESATSERRFLSAPGPVSIVTGIGLKTRPERIEAARELAKKRRRKTGRKVGICPAVLNSWASDPRKRNPIPPNPNAKCGGCTICSNQLWDIVFPAH